MCPCEVLEHRDSVYKVFNSKKPDENTERTSDFQLAYSHAKSTHAFLLQQQDSIFNHSKGNISTSSLAACSNSALEAQTAKTKRSGLTIKYRFDRNICHS